MYIRLKESKCNACGNCAEICPVDAIVVKDVAVVDHEMCIDCGSCVADCPEGALSMEAPQVETIPPEKYPAKRADDSDTSLSEEEYARMMGSNPPERKGIFDRIVDMIRGK